MTSPMTDKTTNPLTSPTRRSFMAMGGAVAGLSSMGLAGWAQNDVEIDVTTLTNTTYQTDVLVIGGGMAGLFAAVKAHDAGAKVMIASKGRVGSSGLTPFAKGYFAYDPDKETLSIDEFVEKVSRSAYRTNNPVYTRQLAENSLARAKELQNWGFFDTTLAHRPFMVPLEARNIPIVERLMITRLIKEDGRIAGAAGFLLDAEKTVTIAAKAIVLCTGAGGFKPSGFPVCDLTHDGSIMAYEIGAKITGKEWNDGHTGRSVNPAACYDGWGNMFELTPSMNSVEVHHDLGVDVNYQAYMQGNPINMGPGTPPDAEQTMVEGGPVTPSEFQRSGPPAGGEGGPAGGPPSGGGSDDGPSGGPAGGPPPGGPGGGPEGGPEGGPPGGGTQRGFAMGGASAGMAIHKSEGLVPVDDRCASNVAGLYAAGDALGSHMSGGIYTQIGSSLAGSAVQGAIAGEAAAEYAAAHPLVEIPAETLATITDEILAPLKREAGYGPAWVTQTLQGVMIPNFVLYVKKQSMMQAALAYIEELRDHHAPVLRAANMHELRLAHETRNMILSAEMKLRASLMRTESRCSHYRLDYTEMDTQNWEAWINISKAEDGTMQLEKQPFSAWPEQA